jgi:predicted site-specific integrase-resolvase
MQTQHLLTTREAAERLALHPDTLKRWRAEGRGPAAIEVTPPTSARPVWRYRAEDVDAWIEGGRVNGAR